MFDKLPKMSLGLPGFVPTQATVCQADPSPQVVGSLSFSQMIWLACNKTQGKHPGVPTSILLMGQKVFAKPFTHHQT